MLGFLGGSRGVGDEFHHSSQVLAGSLGVKVCGGLDKEVTESQPELVFVVHGVFLSAGRMGSG